MVRKQTAKKSVILSKKDDIMHRELKQASAALSSPELVQLAKVMKDAKRSDEFLVMLRKMYNRAADLAIRCAVKDKKCTQEEIEGWLQEFKLERKDLGLLIVASYGAEWAGVKSVVVSAPDKPMWRFKEIAMQRFGVEVRHMSFKEAAHEKGVDV